MSDTGSGRRRGRGQWATGVVCAVIGVMVVSSAIAARGTDLRPTRSGSLRGLVAQESERARELTEQVVALQSEVDALTRDAAPVDRAEEPLSMRQVHGPGVRVTLDDAPDPGPDAGSAGVDADLLVVHQQDIQAVVNALWASGAEAMTIQGQRVVAGTAIKCVGNTVVLQDVPYAPPYVVEAIGDPDRLTAGLDASPDIQIYREYADAYSLGYRQETLDDTIAEPYRGSIQARHATRN